MDTTTAKRRFESPQEISTSNNESISDPVRNLSEDLKKHDSCDQPEIAGYEPRSLEQSLRVDSRQDNKSAKKKLNTPPELNGKNFKRIYRYSKSNI